MGPRSSRRPSRLLALLLIGSLVVTQLWLGSVPAFADEPAQEFHPSELSELSSCPNQNNGLNPDFRNFGSWNYHNKGFAPNLHCSMAGVVISGDGFNPSRTYGNLGVEQIWFDPEVTANARTGVLNCHRAYVRWVPKTAASDNFPGTADSRVRVHVHNASDATGGAEQYAPAYARPNPTTAAAQWLMYWTMQPNDTGALPATHGAYVIFDLSGATWGRLVGGHDFAGPDANWPGSFYGYYIRAHTTTAGRLPPGLSAVDLAPFDGVHYPEGVGFADGCTAGAGQPEGDFGSDKPYTYGFQANQARSPDPVNLATGVFTTQAEDLALPGRVLSLGFTRTYNSADQTTGPLGPAWTHSHNWRLTDNGATVEVRRGDGRRDTFTRNADGSYANPPDTFDVLVRNADGSFTLTLTNQVGYEFSSGGALTRIREPAGNQTTLAYTAGNLTTITDTARQLTLSYDAANRLTQLQDPLGRKVTYAYDPSGRLATVTDKIGNAPGQDPARHQWRYAYDGTTQHLATITDPDGRVRVTNAYDAQGRVSQQRDGLSDLTSFSYGAGQTVLTDPRGTQTTYTFDARMRVLFESTVVGGVARSLSYTYDAVGNRTSVTDRNGKRTDFAYDARGNVLAKTDPSPDGVAPRPLTQFAYDAKNNLTQITDAAGFTTTMTYDAATNVLLSVARQIDATTSATTKYEYADAANPGLPTRIIAPRGNTGATPDLTFATTLAYEAQADLASRTDPDGARTTFSYDAAGRLTSFVDPDGNAAGANPAEHTWTISYDENDRETSRADPLGNTLRFAYDGAGNRTSLTDRRGNVTTYAYDANTRLASVQQKPDPVGNPTLVYTTTVTRDAGGNATRITQANGVATDYAYDALNRLVSVTTDPDAQTTLTTSYALDGNGQPTSRTTADGVTVSYAYDALSRLTSVSATGLSITYAYDVLGRRTQMTDGTGTTTYAYDGIGRLTQVAAPSGTLTYAYDRDGNRTALGYSATESVSYAYSPGGRMTTVTDWAGRVSSYGYFASGLVRGLTFPNALVAAYAYDRAQRLTRLSYTLGTTIVDETYALDPEGNRVAIDSFVQGMPATTGTLRYDGLSRLLAFDRRLALDGGQPFTSESFAHDGATNLTSRTGPAASFSYDGANRLLSDGTRSFVWDRADRLMQRGADTFAYDPLSRLTSSTVAGVTRTYAYDGDGLLRSRTEGAVTASFLYDPAVAPAPLLQAGTERLVYGLGVLYRVHADGSFGAYARDALGSVRAEVSGTGRLTNAHDYTAYGALRASLAGPPLLGFAGELQDPSGLIYLRARWYDPDVGRFLRKDPLLGDVVQPGSLNLYTYVLGNPARFSDPSGRLCVPCAVAVAVLIHPASRGAIIGGAGYVIGLAIANRTRGLDPLDGFDTSEFIVSAASGAATGGASTIPAISRHIGARVAVEASVGYVGGLVTTALTGRFSPVEVVLSSIANAASGFLPVPGGGAGLVIGLAEGGLVNVAQIRMQQWLEGLSNGLERAPSVVSDGPLAPARTGK